jgi:hemerythrin-like domain-containing protein
MTQERDIVDELREIERMNTTLHGAQMAARAVDEIERLRAERDDARREVCGWASRYFNEYSEHIARERGWDCFKEKA